MTIKIAVVSCMQYSSRWPGIRTALRSRGLTDYVIFVGQSPETTTLPDDVVQLGAPDTYEGLPQKIVAVCEFMKKKMKTYDYMWKIDDDVDILMNTDVITMMEHEMLETSRQFFAFNVQRCDGNRKWHFGKCTPGSPWNDREYPGKFPPTWAAGGMTYLLAKNAVEKVANLSPEFTANHIFEDVMVSTCLAMTGVTPMTILRYRQFLRFDVHAST